MVEVTGGRQRPTPKANPQAASPAVPRAARTGPGLARPLEGRARGRFVFTLFFACLLIPAKFDIGTLAMTPDRMLMLILFMPLTIRLLTGRLGGIGAVDIFILLYAAWVFLSLMVWHGASRLQFAGMTVVEMVGGYLFGRAMIRSEADYRTFFRQFYHALLFLLPFALIELFTARLVINDWWGRCSAPSRTPSTSRWGLNRAQTVFQHPILFGLVCSLGVANFYFLNRAAAPARAMFRTGFALFMTFTSLSAGPLLSAMIQCGMIFWEKITRANWKLLGFLGLIGYGTIDLLSNRSPAAVLASYATFDAATAYNRILIWRIGIQTVIDFPIFGIGMNEWRRTGWTWTASVDNFWLSDRHAPRRSGLPLPGRGDRDQSPAHLRQQGAAGKRRAVPLGLSGHVDGTVLHPLDGARLGWALGPRDGPDRRRRLDGGDRRRRWAPDGPGALPRPRTGARTAEARRPSARTIWSTSG